MFRISINNINHNSRHEQNINKHLWLSEFLTVFWLPLCYHSPTPMSLHSHKFSYLISFQADSCSQSLLVVPCLLCNPAGGQSNEASSLVISSQFLGGWPLRQLLVLRWPPGYTKVALLLAAAVHSVTGGCVDRPHLPPDRCLPHFHHRGRAALPAACGCGVQIYLFYWKPQGLA